MNKIYYSLGLMSGTSGDGIDASIIKSDGYSQYDTITNKYFEYNSTIQKNIHKLKEKIANNPTNLLKHSKETKKLENKITISHVEAVKDILNNIKKDIDLIGLHGQTILHSPMHRITKQLGDGKLLSKLTKKRVVYDFRQNDLKNDGQGAPLAPIFHILLKNKHKLRIPLVILNIGGIANITNINDKGKIFSKDVGPGNCLIDQWVRKKSKKKFDEEGKIARSGKINKKLLNKALENFSYSNYHESYDTRDFDSSFVNYLSLKDGAATLVEYTSKILHKQIQLSIDKNTKNILVTGGGRKNKFLLKSIEKKINIPVKLIDDFNINGDFVESQAFAYLAIRSYLGLPISYPETTGCKKPCTGGIIVKSYLKKS